MEIQEIMIDDRKILKFYAEAERELKYNNRFQNLKLNKIVDFLNYSEANRRFIKKETIYFRARIYDKLFTEERGAWDEADTFKGYDKDNSFVNTNFDLVSDGRCNPRWIPYLYVSESVKCCIQEVRPTIGSYVSVASIKVNRALKVLDLSTGTMALMKNDYDDIVEGIPNGCLCQHLNSMFSTPYKFESDYLVTQYLSEKIKNSGYDGVMYESSVYNGKDNINLVIFNYSKCEAIDSKLYKIKGFNIEFESDTY